MAYIKDVTIAKLTIIAPTLTINSRLVINFFSWRPSLGSPTVILVIPGINAYKIPNDPIRILLFHGNTHFLSRDA